MFWCCREKLEEDEDFELIGDVSDALQTDNTNEASTAAANGNDLRTNDGLSLLYTISCSAKNSNWVKLKVGQTRPS